MYVCTLFGDRDRQWWIDGWWDARAMQCMASSSPSLVAIAHSTNIHLGLHISRYDEVVVCLLGNAQLVLHRAIGSLRRRGQWLVLTALSQTICSSNPPCKFKRSPNCNVSTRGKAWYFLFLSNLHSSVHALAEDRSLFPSSSHFSILCGDLRHDSGFPSFWKKFREHNATKSSSSRIIIRLMTFESTKFPYEE